MAPSLLLAGWLFGLLVQRVEFLGVMALYYIVSMAYSLCLKRKLVIDISVLAALMHGNELLAA
jgi:4-hydroxybenzoate polyprenyltransferase